MIIAVWLCGAYNLKTTCHSWEEVFTLLALDGRTGCIASIEAGDFVIVAHVTVYYPEEGR